MNVGEVRVNGERLRRSLERMAEIGATAAGGVHRLALTDEDKRARDLLVQWLAETGAEVAIDELGNIFGRRPGRDDDLPPVMLGSHLDSQPAGGRFDGALGVMGALEVLRVLAEHDIQSRRPVMLVDWTNEEGSRFAPAMMASGAWTGKLDGDWVRRRADVNGATVGSELERIGYKGALPCANWPFSAYFELHIEQGPRLERRGITIGVPKGVVCLHWYDVYLEGTANQVGPTPMEGRNDPLVAAAEMILRVRELPGRMSGDLVATVGEIENHPNSRNVIPGRVHFTVDIRSWDDDLALRAWKEAETDFGRIAARHGCSMKTEVTWRAPHSEFDGRLVEQVHSAAESLGYATLPMVSGAGHDASYMAMVGPAAMVFVPSIDGRSHVEVERTSWEDCAAGADVLLQCALRSADVVER